MPIKMIASRPHYVEDERREYSPGEVFEVADDRAAERLVRLRKATRQAEPEPEPAPKPSARRTTRTVVADPASEPKPDSDVGTYRRRDMRAED